jgi:hypothetical protein
MRQVFVRSIFVMLDRFALAGGALALAGGALALAGGALALTGCGLADSHSAMPEFLRVKMIEPLPEQAPDVAQLVREGLDSIFVASSNPQKVRVSPPRHDLHGQGWTACVKADLTSAMGKPLGEGIYRITISGGVVVDRRRAESEDTCAIESYLPI